MSNLIVIHADFEAQWPLVAERLQQRWQALDETALIRLVRGDTRSLREAAPHPHEVSRLVCLGVPVTAECLQRFGKLREAAFLAPYGPASLPQSVLDQLQAQGVKWYQHRSEGFWGQSVAEFALALTLCALRRIPQNYHEMLTSLEPWRRYSGERNQGPGAPGAQFSDDATFTHGTVAGKRVRVVGAGNIGSRYASFVHALGADVAAWDPYAPEPGFHRAGSRRVHHLSELVKDAEIFAPMLPLTEATRGAVTAAHIDALPTGCLVVLATRALICDMEALRRRVLADELSLAADVFDIEPLPLDDPLLGRHNVVHTPHLAGRTRDANYRWADDLLDQFEPVVG
jgi:phosphoglycerate dehydrogenase-like enzyme